MSEAADMPQDKLVDGRYRIVGKIADGGMATVYKAVDVRLGREVALKVMHVQLAQGPQRDQFVERFHREAKSAAAIANPHVVQVYDTGETDDGLDYLVMEYVHGVNLRHEMQSKRTFSVRETLRIVGETLSGLASAHAAGVVHRDVKPENILINDRGRVQITDFGLAKAASQATLSSTGMLLGTAAYLAPEMIEHNQATAQGDCYSVGIMAWEMLTGQVPFLSDNPVTMVFKHVNENVPSVATVCTGIDPQVARYVSWLTNRAVGNRPKDAQEALDRLRTLLKSLSPEALAYRYDPDAPKPLNATTVLPLAAPGADGAQAADGSSPLNRQVSARVPQGNDLPTTTVSTTPPNDDPTVRQEKPKHRHRALVIWIVGVLVVLAAAAGGFAWWYFRGPGSYYALPQPEGLKCAQNAPCAIKDVQWASYEKQLKAEGIPYTTKEAYSDDVASGDIIATDPVYVDSHVSKRTDQKVEVTVSQGVRMATVPTDIMSVDDPVEALKQAGFDDVTNNSSDDEWSMDVPEGHAISVSVQPGAQLAHNTPITVKLSKGPMPVQMPDVIGKTKEEALSLLDAAKLKVTFAEQYDDKVEAGKVLFTNTDAGATLHWGDSVTVTLSKGPEMVTVPNVVGKKLDEAKKTLEDLGLEVKTSAPLGNLLDTVRIQSPKAGEQVRKRGEDGKATVVTLTVV
ncbi:MAG: PASTA domain-containing protein [Bifidobacterium sp.]|nr:PASTA domain-containing protein [Bifidobacterium sp.]